MLPLCTPLGVDFNAFSLEEEEVLPFVPIYKFEPYRVAKQTASNPFIPPPFDFIPPPPLEFAPSDYDFIPPPPLLDIPPPPFPPTLPVVAASNEYKAMKIINELLDVDASYVRSFRSLCDTYIDPALSIGLFLPKQAENLREMLQRHEESKLPSQVIIFAGYYNFSRNVLKFYQFHIASVLPSWSGWY